MSSSNSQRMRRIASVSPGSGKSQRPMKATLSFNLKGQSPTTIGNQNNYGFFEGSRVKTQRSPECKTAISPERTRPASPCTAKEKWRSVSGPKITTGSSMPVIHRTSSLDAIYLAGQWPRDCPHTYCGRLLLDKGTQTPDGWDEVPDRRKTLPPRSHSAGTGDQLEKIIRHRLPRASKDSRQRFSPIPQPGPTATVPVPFQTPVSRVFAVPAVASLAIPKQTLPRMRSSVEGFNQEIEKHFSSNEEEQQRVTHPTPDGHRAPIADMFRNNTRHVNTQTPLGGVTVTGGETIAHADSDATSSASNSGNNSRCQSYSPSVSFAVPVPVSLEEEEYEEAVSPFSRSRSRSPSETYETKLGLGDSQEASPELEGEAWLGTSPRINKFLAREPPDGCERVRIEEIRELPTECASQLGLKPCVNFILKPSSSSAFYPLCVRQQLQSTLPVTGVDIK